MILKNLQYGVVALLLSSTLLLAAQHKDAAAAQSTAAKPPTKTTAAASDSSAQSEGQPVFDQQCARCHNAPDGFSSRISGTIIRHMRVRASLSKRDEAALLRFLNP